MSVETVAPGGLEAVQARIAALQSRIGSLSGAPATPTVLSSASTSDSSTPGPSTDLASSSDFSSSLAAALGDDGSTDSSLDLSGTDSSATTATTATSPTSGTTATTGGASPTADAVISIAKRYLGIPYKWGGTDPATGLDCSGLTQLVYRQVGVSLPRVAADQAKVGTAVSSLATARPGDLLFFHQPVSHVAIYLGGGKMLEAPHTGANVRISDVWATPSHIRRVLPGAATTFSAARTGTTPYADIFRTEGARANVAPALLAAVAKVESGFRADATSPAGAQGLMQLMPGTARGLRVDPTDPQQAVRGAARLLSTYLKVYGGDLDRTLAAYNAGPVAVRQYGGVPPYAETQAYVRKVRAAISEVSV